MIDQDDEDDDSLGDDPEFPENTETPWDDGESAETEPCPYCKEPVHEQAEVCPHCGNYISQEDSTNRKPLWIVVGVIILLILVLLAWF